MIKTGRYYDCIKKTEYSEVGDLVLVTDVYQNEIVVWGKSVGSIILESDKLGCKLNNDHHRLRCNEDIYDVQKRDLVDLVDVIVVEPKEECDD